VTVGATGWVPDVLPGYWQTTIPLGLDPAGEGEVVATLMRRGDPVRADHAVLAIHGFTDYFFHSELADHFADRGFAFYAMDLQKCGRSRRTGQTPHFITDMSGYDVELEHARRIIGEETGSARLLTYGHSTGALILALWLDRLRRRGALARTDIGGLVLNSPWLDLPGHAILRLRMTSATIATLSRLRTKGVIRGAGNGGYGTSLHRDYHGEFEYNLEWKPLGGFPITLGWLHAMRRGQARLQRGLDVGVPNLILRSDHTVREDAGPDAVARGDAVLDVRHIARWAGCIGNRSTIIPVTDAKHDVFLSLAEPRRLAYRHLDHWLDEYLNSRDNTMENHDVL
jgi:alpha-beta hydrolase superfamily lysophospholipase